MRTVRSAGESVAYKQRVKSQLLSWARGAPFHNPVDDECCPDFSCCHPDLFETDEVKRWGYYREHSQ